MTNQDSEYLSCVQNSERVSWRLDELLPKDTVIDFSANSGDKLELKGVTAANLQDATLYTLTNVDAVANGSIVTVLSWSGGSITILGQNWDMATLIGNSLLDS